VEYSSSQDLLLHEANFESDLPGTCMAWEKKVVEQCFYLSDIVQECKAQLGRSGNRVADSLAYLAFDVPQGV